MEPVDLQNDANQTSNKRKTSEDQSSSSTPRRTRPKASMAKRPGEDFILESSDGIQHNVHSVILSVASPVFANMFELGVPGSGEVLKLEENDELLTLMLQFIYPNESPDISSFEVLEEALRVADKYELDGMQQQLRQKLMTTGSPVSVYANPLSAFLIASSHGLEEEAQRARTLVHKNHDFASVDGLMQLAEIEPTSRTWISLIGVPNVINKAITDVLFSFHKQPMLLSAACSFVCKRCKDSLDSFGDHYSPPEWQARWAHALSAELKKRPMDEWKSCFEYAFLYENVSRNWNAQTSIRSSQGLCTCLKDIARTYSGYFTVWSLKVHERLMKRLKELDKLEDMIKS